MKEVFNKDIFNYAQQLYDDNLENKQYEYPFIYIVIPSNIGWKANGENVMGAGIAKQVRNMFPDIPLELGRFYKYHLKEYKSLDKLWYKVYYKYPYSFVALPTKSLNKEYPHLSWKNQSNLEEIEKSCKILADDIKFAMMGDIILLPYLGCGNGGLNKSDVKPILDKYFGDLDNVILFNND